MGFLDSENGSGAEAADKMRLTDNRPIGVFDSGLGGLTVVREFVKVLPNEDIVYFGDTGRVPYGSRSPLIIEKYARQDENFLLSMNVKLIIAACGTVSAVASHTGDLLPVPFIEVVTPAAIAAVSATRTGSIGVIGTSATINSGSYTRKILELKSDAKVISNDCPLFVPLVEAGWIDQDDPVTIETARRYLEPLKSAGVDTLILGCTHYPVLMSIIGNIMGGGVKLINTGETAAMAAADYISKNGLLNVEKSASANGSYKRPGTRDGSGERRQSRFYVSDHTESFSVQASILLGRDIGESVERVDITKF